MSDLDHHLVSDNPTPLYMGELPPDYVEAPAPVVINLCGVFPRVAAYGQLVFALPMHDTLEPDLVPPRKIIEAFLDAIHPFARTQPTYWHCHAGLNRSGMLIAAYLHRRRGMRISDAISTLRERRSDMVLCNSLFERLLREWYGDQREQDFVPFDSRAWEVGKNGSKR